MITYDNLRRKLPLPDAYAAWSPLIAGVAARTFVSSIGSPLELLRTRLQATPADPYKPHTVRSVVKGIRLMVQHNGVLSMWKGLGPTLWRDVPFSGLYWAGYESIKGRLRRRGHQGSGVAFVSGAISGTVSFSTSSFWLFAAIDRFGSAQQAAAMVTLPFDVLKTRRQALLAAVAQGKDLKLTATIPLLRQIVRTEGPKALFAGLTPRIAKIAPACGIMIACYEVSTLYLSSYNLSRI